MLPLHLILVALSTVSLIYAGFTGVRKLQGSANFRANYTADFQYLRDIFCLGDAPVLQVTCFGNLTILGTSDPSIQCQLSTPDVENRTTYQCINTCVGADCKTIYLASDDVSDGPFASIYFTCEGDKIQDVDAYVNFLGGNNGTCADSTGSGTTVTRNFHVARLGVSCPVGSSRAYVYDDTYFECRSLGSFVLNSATNNDDKYACASGQNCDGFACEVSFSDVYINADVPRFLDSCVESAVPITDFPTFAPAASSSEFSARFVASWGRLHEPILSASNCVSDNPTVVVSCGNGASISLVNSTDVLMKCFYAGANELKCLGDDRKIDNSFTSVTYDCVGPALPTARVTYPESTVYCNGNIESTVVRHVASLGMVCNISSGTILFHGDLYFDCAELNDQFDIENIGDFGLGENRYVCGQSATFPAGSLSTNPIILSDAAVTTDVYWLMEPDDICFNLRLAPVLSSAPTHLPTAPPVSNAPISPFPSSGLPTESPTELNLQTQPPTDGTAKIATTNPTSGPKAVPVNLPFGPKSNPPTTVQNRSSNAGAIAGGCIAGIAVLGILVFLLHRNSNGLNNRNNPNPLTSGAYASAPQRNSDVRSVYQEYIQFFGTNEETATPTSGSHRGISTDVANAHEAPVTPPHARSMHSTSPNPPSGSYEICYKDQSRTVIFPSPSTDPVDVTPIAPSAEAIPMALAGPSTGKTMMAPAEVF